MIWAKVASVLMFCGVALGAFGSHALKNKISDYHLDVYKTGILYHFIHALGLFVVAWLVIQLNDPKFNSVGVCLTIGIILFSGSLYLYSVTNIRWLGFVTPFGGLFFLLAWILLFFKLS